MSRLSQDEREFIAHTDAPAPGAAGLSAAPAASAASATSAAQVLDARGISRPLPVLRAHRALRGMQRGQLLNVVTSQPETLAEFQALVKHVPDYELVSQEELGGEYFHVLRRCR